MPDPNPVSTGESATLEERPCREAEWKEATMEATRRLKVLADEIERLRASLEEHQTAANQIVGQNVEMHAEVQRLTAERDEWHVRAEQLHDTTLAQEADIDALMIECGAAGARVVRLEEALRAEVEYWRERADPFALQRTERIRRVLTEGGEHAG